MNDLDRRSVMGLGIIASATVIPWPAAAQTPQGKELAPGVRQIDYGERDSLIAAYKKVRLRDVVISPGAHTPAWRTARVPRQGRGCDALPLDLDEVGRARDLLG